MKRFYCTICKRVKRVRKYPQSVLSPLAEKPQDRIGECDAHFSTSMAQGKSRQMRDFALKNNLPIIEITTVKAKSSKRRAS